MTNWTPGPWRVGRYSDSLDIIGTFVGGDASGSITILTDATLSDDLPIAQREANANLAAAAPELYAALHAFESWEYCDDGGRMISKLQTLARAILARARGEHDAR